MKKTTTITMLCAFSVVVFLFGASAANAGCCWWTTSEAKASVTVEGDDPRLQLWDVMMSGGPRGVADKFNLTKYSQKLVFGKMGILTVPSGHMIVSLGGGYYLLFLPDGVYQVKYLAPVTEFGKGTRILSGREDPENTLKDAIERTARTFYHVNFMIIDFDLAHDPNVVKRKLGLPAVGGGQYGSASVSAGKETAREEQIPNLLAHAFEVLMVGKYPTPVVSEPEPQPQAVEQPVVEKPVPAPKPCYNDCREIQEKLMKRARRFGQPVN